MDRVREVIVPEGLDGARLDKALVELVPGASRAKVRKAIEAGGVRVGGRIRAKGEIVRAGDSLSFEDVDLVSQEVPPLPEPEAKLDVLFESKDVLVVNKPAGQPCAPLRASETGTLANALIGHYPELAGVGYGPREPGLVHRLDTDTSGLVVVARNHDSFSTLKEALFAERIHKTYLLVCEGEGLADTGEVSFPIANHPKDSRRVLACVHPRDVMRNAPRPAHTRWMVEARNGRWALVRARAPRALRHQIRVHFAALEHPLAGDTLYGGPAELPRQALHAASVALPGSFEVASALPEDMQALFDRGT